MFRLIDISLDTEGWSVKHHGVMTISLTRWSPDVVLIDSSERTDRRLLRWYAMRRVVERLVRSIDFYYCTSRTRPIGETDFKSVSSIERASKAVVLEP